ncbi:cytochrome P450 315a1, mitochondrial [Papilio machaon]|uniref:cytochrome P450 315a1, mitochondrial n=1 Tax=Papilio machaon TaxID=76193 RepID=UPI001E665854|nr:cytochrome P450 315a1, mitochondrial [Papilio machaon]
MNRLSGISKGLHKYIFNSAEQYALTLTIKDMPRPKTLPIIGTKLDFLLAGRGTKLHDYIDARHKQLGSIFTENLGGNTDLVFISDSDLMKSLFLNLEGKYPVHILPEPWVLYEKLYDFKRGLFFMNGEEWLENRRIMNKHLLRENSDAWLETPIKETVKNFVGKWKNRAAGASCVISNLDLELYKLSTDVIIKVLLGADSKLSESRQYEDLISIFSQEVKKIFQTTTKLYGLPLNLCQRLNLKVWTDFKESVDSSIFLAQKIVNEILLNKNKTNGLIKKLSDDNVSDEIIKKIAVDFVIAAGDTTSYSTFWSLLMLSENNETIKDVREQGSSFVKHVVKETMRLYPVAPFLTRILPQECLLGPYKINKGTPIIASIYTSGRDEHNFSNAHMFLPYRWDRNDPRKASLKNHVPSATLPFALGARTCIGKRIAMMQLTEIIEQIVNNFNFKIQGGENVKPITCQVLVPDRHVELFLNPKET